MHCTFKQAAAAATALIAVGSAQVCSSLDIDKKVPATGKIIVAHNEDNGGRLFNMHAACQAQKGRNDSL